MTLPDVAALVSEAQTREELAALAGRFREGELLAEGRLRSMAAPASTNGHEPERLLTPEEAASILGGVSTKWVLRHTKGLRFRRDLSRKVVRFEDAGLRRWASAQRA